MSGICVKYFIPEDGDEETHPNVYFMPSGPTTLLDINKTFPVPGNYHFRFLRAIGDMKVWMDVSDPQTSIPISDGTIFAKVSRISVPVINVVAEKPKQSSDIGTSVPKKATETSISSPSVTSTKMSPVVEQIVEVPKSTSNLINFGDESDPFVSSSPAKTSAPAAAADSDLLGFDAPVAAKTNTNVDLFGLDFQPQSQAVPSTGLNGGGIPAMKLQQPTPNPMGGRPMGMSSNSPGGPMNSNVMGGSYAANNMGGGYASSNPMMGGMNNSRPPMSQQFDAFSGLGSTGNPGGGRGGNQYSGSRGGAMGQQQWR